MVSNFFGNAPVAETLVQMARSGRIPQTILLSGPEGIGKATLARRFGALLLPGGDRIERDDLSLPENASLISDREKLAAEKRNEDPLLFSSHPDFVTFPPDGPLRQISIPQMRLLKELSQYKPSKGSYRVFLIDQIQRANEQAANSLLKTLEEPPEHLILVLTAQNPYDLLPTIRSRAVMLQMCPLNDEEMLAFSRYRNLDQAERRLALAQGSPGVAVSLDLELFDKRRSAMLQLLQSASGRTAFAEWARTSEALGNARSEKLDVYLEVLYDLLEDILLLRHGVASIRNTDVRAELQVIAGSVTFDWIRRAVLKLDELVEFARRNIQKNVALDALVVELQGTGTV
ncbi:MAG TPA: DNA polymerase III subunit delta' [Bryobacteraceae bacterium]|nr:DNA polymerase III subunit delta' [Bryobacteraceae bacterium]